MLRSYPFLRSASSGRMSPTTLNGSMSSSAHWTRSTRRFLFHTQETKRAPLLVARGTDLGSWRITFSGLRGSLMLQRRSSSLLIRSHPEGQSRCVSFPSDSSCLTLATRSQRRTQAHFGLSSQVLLQLSASLGIRAMYRTRD